MVRNFTVNGKPRDIQLLISKLKFISKIQKGEKVNVSKLTLEENGWLVALLRTTLNVMVNEKPETRENSLEFIQSVSNEAIECIEFFLKQENRFHKDIGDILLVSLKEIKIGVSSQIDTYHKHQMFISKVDTFLKVLDVKLKDLEHRKEMIIKKEEEEAKKKEEEAKRKEEEAKLKELERRELVKKDDEDISKQNNVDVDDDDEHF